MRAIRYLGGEVPNKEKALGIREILFQTRHRCVVDTPGAKGDLPATAIGMMALAELEPGASQEKSAQFLTASSKTFEERRLAVAGMEAAGRFCPEVRGLD